MLWPVLREFRGLGPSWLEMDRLQREMDRLFSGVSLPFAHNFPALNVWTSEQDAVITAEIPGVDPDELDISVVDEILTLSGSRTLERLEEGETYHRQEREHGRFARTVKLPFRVNAEKVGAVYERGVLKITLPRAEEDKPKKIKIKSE
jgi:HSP20 family protein